MRVRTVGAYEAKTHLPRLLDAVARGESITITRHGRPVALLLPPPGAGRKDVRTIIAAFREFRRGKSLGVSLTRGFLHAGHRF